MKLSLLSLSLLLCSGLAFAGTLTYTPVGPQTNVAISTVTDGGWTQCYAATMDVFIGDNAENVLSVCSGDYLMMAGRETGSDTLLLLAEAPYADTIFNTGMNTDQVHEANGSGWYFAANWSWGFSGLSESMYKSECDTAEGADKMCLHTVGQAGGFRIGGITSLNGSTDYEKVFFVANASAVSDTPEPATAALLGLGLAALLASRGRKRA
jgi:hypothetical protein